MQHTSVGEVTSYGYPLGNNLPLGFGWESRVSPPGKSISLIVAHMGNRRMRHKRCIAAECKLIPLTVIPLPVQRRFPT